MSSYPPPTPAARVERRG